MEVYKIATKQKLRVPTPRGPLSVEQLWDLSIEELDILAVKLKEEYEGSGKKSFIAKKSEKDKTAKLMFDVVLDILTTKADEAEAALEAREVKKHNEKIMDLIAKKQDEALSEKSIADLKKMLKS
jgi:hypothetical protein